jgi:WhiB family redox-sensing transcriptional regulator
MTVILSEANAASWMERGACRDEDPELFFPIGVQGDGESQARRAVSVCNGCAVREECLRYALDNSQQHGVWGGLTEEERVAMLRRERTRRRRARRAS